MSLLEKAGEVINFFVEILEVVSTGKLAGAISRLGHTKKIDEAAASAPASESRTASEAREMKSRIGGLGPKDNIIRENVVNLLDPDRQATYRRFERWLKKKSPHTWSALMHYLTTQAEYDARGAQITVENIVDIVVSNGEDAGLNYVQALTEEILTELVKVYGKKSWEALKKIPVKEVGKKLKEIDNKCAPRTNPAQKTTEFRSWAKRLRDEERGRRR